MLVLDDADSVAFVSHGSLEKSALVLYNQKLMELGVLDAVDDGVKFLAKSIPVLCNQKSTKLPFPPAVHVVPVTRPRSTLVD